MAPTHHHKPGPEALAAFETFDAHFYEWNEAEGRWIKLHEEDPNPPKNLKPGHFDGQLIEA